MDHLLEQTLLFDFYGELLTERQKEVYLQFVQEDLSLSEIAENTGLSRQGVHDLVRRTDRILASYEEKLHLVEHFFTIRRKVERMEGLLKQRCQGKEEPLLEEVQGLAREILEEL